MPPATTATPAPAAIALGSNLGDRRAHIDSALRALAALPGTELVAASDPLETDPVGPVPQGRFLNAAAILRTTLGPRELLDHLLRIEHEHARDRDPDERWGPRTLDLDLLVYADRVIDEPGLTVPHPRLHERRFVLDPLVAIVPDLVVPGLNRTVRDLHRALHAPESALP